MIPIEQRFQEPAFNVHDFVARHNGFLNAGAPESTPRNQERIGAMRTPVEHHNYPKVAVAGAHLPQNPVVSPTQRKNSVQVSRIDSRDITGVNYASHKGSGSNNKPKPIAGSDDVFNVGGSGGRSAILQRIPNRSNSATHSSIIANRKVLLGATQKNDPTKEPLNMPHKMVPVHLGFHHVGYRKVMQ